MKLNLPRLLLAVPLFLLGACGTGQSGIGDQVRQVFSQILPQQTEAVPLRDRLTPQVLQSIGTPILLVGLPKGDTEAGAQLLRESNGVEIWSTLNGIQFMFTDGVLTASRGQAGDLLSADLSEVSPAVKGARSEALRVHRYLDGEDQVFARAYVCDYERIGGQTTQTVTGTYTTTLVQEDCVSSDDSFQNQYWIDRRGVMRKSKQWVGPFVEFVETELIND